MALTCGFFNSTNHDRRYDARQFSHIFDGLITDGIFATVGDSFIVNARNGRSVTVGTGRAWFNGTWTWNDSLLPVEMPLPDAALNRIDTIVLEVDTRDSVRNNRIRVVQGAPAVDPIPLESSLDEGLYRYPLCHVFRKPNTVNINQADITNCIGSTETPFVTGILQTISLEDLLGQWEAELDNFVASETFDFAQWTLEKHEEFEAWSELQQSLFEDFQNERQNSYDVWLENTANTFNSWLGQLQTDLETDVAANLQLQIQTNEIKRILTSGFADGTKTISTDGRTIISTADDGRTLTKVFSEDFSTVTVTLKSSQGGTLATQTKIFDQSGELVTISTTYTYGQGGLING